MWDVCDALLLVYDFTTTVNLKFPMRIRFLTLVNYFDHSLKSSQNFSTPRFRQFTLFVG